MVAAAVSRVVHGELGLVLAAKIGAPWSHELAIGAVAPDGIPLLDDRMLSRLRLDTADVDAEVARAVEELERRRAAYQVVDPPVADRIVVVVDDGVATGATLRAALGFVRRLEPDRLVCAVPVGPPSTIDLLAYEVDEVVCPLQPQRFRAVGEWYEDFGQTSDAEVMGILAHGS